MCGIFALLNNISLINEKTIRSSFEKGSKRGPEESRELLESFNVTERPVE